MSQEKLLQSIKSRMGWQLVAQAATVLAIGAVNRNIKEQTDVLGEKLTEIKNINEDGFRNVSDAIQSLEGVLIGGIEDLKWLLGSIDDKLGKLIGLIEFPKATESSEQFKLAIELFNQEFYDKSLNYFESSINKNPLNLNAKIGCYLCLSKLNESEKNIPLLVEIIKLTDSNFSYHLDISKERKDNSIVYFSKFAINELANHEEYEKVIELYESELLPVAKADLSIHINYISAKIILKREFQTDVSDLINQGKLLPLMLYARYVENEPGFKDFFEYVNTFLSGIFVNEKGLLTPINDPKLNIQKKANTFLSQLSLNKENLLNFGFFESNLTQKISLMKTFFESAHEAQKKYELSQTSLQTYTDSLSSVKSVEAPTFYSHSEQFSKDSYIDIRSDIKKCIGHFLDEKEKDLEATIKACNSTLLGFEKNYPKLEDESEESYQVVRNFLRLIKGKQDSKLDLNAVFSQA
jgi:tetratricopeptide (TPR) repeat protein